MHLTHAYILAGGQSSRFGSDKARAIAHGTPLILRHVPTLTQLNLTVTAIAATADAYADLALRTIADRHPGQGPLAGLEAALLDARTQHGSDTLIALLPCDLLALNPAWLETLAAACTAESPAAAFFTDRWQPLPAVYGTPLLPRVQQHLAADTRALWRLLEAAGAARVDAPTDWPVHLQVNTPDELERASHTKPDAQRPIP